MAKKSNNSGSKLSLNKVSFWLIATTAIMYLIAFILQALHLGIIVSVFEVLAHICTLSIVAILAWRFVAGKPTVWKVLYFVCLLVVIVFMILGKVHLF